MSRSVKVTLEADVSRYVPNVKSAAAATEDLDDKVKSVDTDLDKIPPDAAKAAAAMKALGDSAGDVGDQIKSIGDKSVALSVLDRKIAASRAEVRKLTDEFLKTGDVDVFKRLGEASGRSRALADIRKTLVSSMKEVGGSGATTFAAALQGGIMNAFKSMPGTAKAALITAVAAVAIMAAPLVAATIGAAIIGGVGAGGLVGGIMAAARDPAVGKAWGEVADVGMEALTGAGTVFVNPLIKSAATVRAALVPLGAQLQDVFAPLARTIGPLTEGLLGMADRAMPGLIRAAAAAEPLLTALGEELPGLGASFSEFFESISDGSEGAILALRFLVRFIGANIEAIGTIVEYGSKAFEKIAYFGERVAHLFGAEGTVDRPRVVAQHWGDTIERTGGQILYTTEQLRAFSQAVNATEMTMDRLVGQMVGRVFDGLMSLDQATLGWHRSLLAVKESLEENGRSLDINTSKGIANRETILGAVSANMQLYQANIAAGMSADDAAAQYDAGTRSLERQMRQAGLTQGQIDGLIGKYRGVPAIVRTEIAMKGLENAIRDLEQTIRLINGLHSKTITITVKQAGDLPRGQSRGGGFAQGGIRRAQQGLIIPPSDPGTVITAEPQTGGEALIPLMGISQGRAMGLMQTVGNGYGLDVVPRGSRAAGVTVSFTGMQNDFDRLMSAWFMDRQRTGRIQIIANAIVGG